jgi:transcriptional regulator with XRE-family HTH domain
MNGAMTTIEFAAEVQRVRRAANQSQRAFGEAHGLNQTDISRVERALPIGRPRVRRVADALGLGEVRMKSRRKSRKSAPDAGPNPGKKTSRRSILSVVIELEAPLVNRLEELAHADVRAFNDQVRKVLWDAVGGRPGR